MVERALSRGLFDLERVERPEYLDLGYGDQADVAANLGDMHRINWLLRGTSTLTRHLYPRLSARKGPLRLLDLGTGSAWLPAEIAAWAGRQGIQVQVVGLDWARRNLAAAGHERANGSCLSLLCADASHPPFQKGAVDFITSSLFLHHFSPNQVTQLLRTAYHLCAGGILMSDLIRGWLPYIFSRLMMPVLFRNFLSRHDGPLSVRRAYTPGELKQLARTAGLPDPKVYVDWPWRMTLVVDK